MMRFGWIPPEERTKEQEKTHELLVSSMPSFELKGSWKAKEKVFFWDASKAVTGKHLKTFNQNVGSCFPAGCLVTMADGSLRPIEDVCLGDLVVSHTGIPRKVTRLYKKPYSGKLLTVSVKGHHTPLLLTPEHPVAVHESVGNSHGYKPGPLVWKDAGDLDTFSRVLVPFAACPEDVNSYIDVLDYLDKDECITDETPPEARKVPVLPGHVRVFKGEKSIPRFIKVDEKFARLAGLYLAEGGYDGKCRPNRITLSFNRKEEHLVQESIELFKEVFKTEGSAVYPNTKKTVSCVRVGNSTLAALFKKLFGDTLYSKKVPAFFFRASRLTKLSLIRGWHDGDGHIKKGKTAALMGISASHSLVKDLYRLSLSCGIKPNYGVRKQYEHQNVPAVTLSFYGDNTLPLYPCLEERAAQRKYVNPRYRKVEHGFTAQVLSISEYEVVNTNVYNLEVEEDHSYVVDGIAVHNCTGQGKAMVEWYLMCLEVLRGDPEQVIMPYEPYGYAQGRVCAGISGDQDGGLGSGTAEAARKYGVLRSDLQGLPKWNESEDTIDWPGEVDKSWGRRGAEQKWVTEGVKHLVKTTALISSADRAAEALQNGYPITIASNWGGHMDDVPLAGTPQVRLNKRVTTWMHQMCVIGWWDHPTLKEIYYVQNSWSARRHGTPVNGEPPGGFWIDKNNMNYILRQGDSYAFSTFDGFPADTIPWLFL